MTLWPLTNATVGACLTGWTSAHLMIQLIINWSEIKPASSDWAGTHQHKADKTWHELLRKCRSPESPCTTRLSGTEKSETKGSNHETVCKDYYISSNLLVTQEKWCSRDTASTTIGMKAWGINFVLIWVCKPWSQVCTSAQPRLMCILMAMPYTSISWQNSLPSMLGLRFKRCCGDISVGQKSKVCNLVQQTGLRECIGAYV